MNANRTKRRNLINRKTSNADLANTYEAAKEQAETLLNLVAALVEDHGQGEKIHWGHIGDLHHVNNQLSEIAGFLNGQG